MANQMLINIGQKARRAAYGLGLVSTVQKNRALLAMANALKSNVSQILEANKLDVEATMAKDTTKAFIDRLMLNEKRIVEMAEGLEALVALQDPVGEVDKMWTTPNGLQIGQMRVPLGVVGMIYEARPNVTVDAAGIAIKTGNAIILRGSSEAIHSNMALTKIISSAVVASGLPDGAIQIVEATDRETAVQMMRLNEYIDVLIPRGGAGLIQAVVKNATVPVIETGIGNCHIFVDETADLANAVEIIVNAKCQRPGVCNSAETILVHKTIAEKFLPIVAERLIIEGVELRCCRESQKIISNCKPATEEDWEAEFLDLILAVKVVNKIDEALEHIQQYGTKHSEAILTNDYQNSQRFLKTVDAAAVYVNASTRFTDGSQFGFGAEIGISTQKLHARGPMGLKELTTIKYIVYGNGQIRE